MDGRKLRVLDVVPVDEEDTPYTLLLLVPEWSLTNVFRRYTIRSLVRPA